MTSRTRTGIVFTAQSVNYCRECSCWILPLRAIAVSKLVIFELSTEAVDGAGLADPDRVLQGLRSRRHAGVPLRHHLMARRAVFLPVQVAAQAGHQQHGLPQRDVVQPGRLLGLRLAGQGEAHMAGVSSSMAVSDRRGSTSRRTTSARSASSPRIAASRSRAVRRHGHPDLRCLRGRAGGVPRLEAPAVSGHQKVLAGTENPLVRHQYSASPKKMEKSMIVLSTLH